MEMEINMPMLLWRHGKSYVIDNAFFVKVAGRALYEVLQYTKFIFRPHISDLNLIYLQQYTIYAI
jgi:hypothetical protein